MSDQRDLNGILLLLGAAGTLAQVYWQLDMKLPTWQRRTACLMFIAQFFVLLQYGLAVLQWTPGFATGLRGTFNIAIWVGASMLWATVTLIDNRRVKQRVGAKSHIWKREFWQDMFGDDTQ